MFMIFHGIDVCNGVGGMKRFGYRADFFHAAVTKQV